MITQLLTLAEEHLHGISRNIPELVDIDSDEVSSVTSQTVVNTIMQQARKGNVYALREMLSGVETDPDHAVIQKLQTPVVSQLQSRLNISSDTAQQLAAQALPVIMNMLNTKVKSAQHGGLNIHDALSALNGKGNGLLGGLFGLLGGNTKSNRTINNILQNLIG